jgi:DNA primase
MQKMNLTQQIKDINLVELAESEGIKLKRGGACCPFPFHKDQNPSFHVYGDSHFKCFGCGEYGDAADFIQRLHGLSFKEALQHLGIKQGPVTVEMRNRIKQAERKRREKKIFEKKQMDFLYTLAVEIRRAHKLINNIKTIADMEILAELFHKLSYWEHCWDVLFEGGQNAKAVMKQLNGMKIIKRNLLFKPDFDYLQWLRGTYG